MTAPPNPTTFMQAGTTRTEAVARAFFEAWLAWEQQLPGAAPGAQLTINSGAVTATRSAHFIETEGGAASDDLATIATASMPDGSILRIWASDTNHTVVVKHAAGGAGQIHLANAADFALDDDTKALWLERRSADWYEISRFHGAALPILDSLLTTRGDIIRRGATAPQRLARGSSGQVVQSDGTDTIYGPLTAGAFPTGPGVVTPAMLANGAALSLLGVAGNAGAARADITAGNDGDVMRRSGTGIGFGSILGSKVTNGSGVAGTTVNDALDTLASMVALSIGRTTVRVATTANVTISTALNNGDTLDGISLVTGDLVLVKNQTAPEQNGVYVVGVSPARSTEFDAWTELVGALLVVQEGTANADSVWICTSNGGGTIDTTAVTFGRLQAYDAALVSLAGLSLSNGDLLYATAADTLARLAAGSNGNLLTLSGGVPAWGAYPTLVSLEGLSLASGDLLYATAADTLARRAIGSTNDYLQVVGGVPTWVARPTLESLEGLSLVSGDVLYATAADTLARLPKGTDGQKLELASGVPSWKWPEETFGFAISDETTAITTGAAKLTVRPWAYAFTVSAVRASLNVASSSGAPTVDINEGGTTILSTKLTIDANELTSTTAATAAVISDASIAADAEITFDIDVAGTGAKGLKVYITGRRT